MKMALLSRVSSGLSKLWRNSTNASITQIRSETTKAVAEEEKKPVLSGMNPNKWVNHWMVRDVKRRRIAKEHATMRVRLISMKRNDILPPEIRELASKDMDEIPRQAALRQLTPRCAITSRGRGTVLRWRLSRIVFRDLADYNKLAGVQRAMW